MWETAAQGRPSEPGDPTAKRPDHSTPNPTTIDRLEHQSTVYHPEVDNMAPLWYLDDGG
jgi:hypothetical protein